MATRPRAPHDESNVSVETPKLRPCLSPTCAPHSFLTTRAVRICPAGRYVVNAMDPLYGDVGVNPSPGRVFRPVEAFVAVEG